MMRITESRGEGAVVRMSVEGRLTAATVAQLGEPCDEALRRHLTPMLDLAGVSYADDEGVALIERLGRAGAVVIGCSSFLTALLRGDRLTPGSDDAGAPSEEAGLVERLRRGDDAAFAEVMRRYGGRLLATARRMLGSDDAAEDAVQEAFLSAFKHIGQFAGSSKLSTWLHRIVVNTALMRMRGRRARPEVAIEDLLPRFQDDGHWADRIAGSDEAAESLCGRAETRRLVRRCIEQLPEAYRTVLLMRDIEELDTDEAAALLGVTPNAVKIRLHRARQALRGLIETQLRANEHAADLCAAG